MARIARTGKACGPRAPWGTLNRRPMRLRQCPAIIATVLTASRVVAGGPADVKSEEIRRHVTFLGDDARGGRAVGTAGIEQAARYLVAELAGAGLPPLPAAPAFLQAVPLHASRPAPHAEVLLVSDCGSGPLRVGDECLIEAGGEESLIPQPADVVFAGYGIVAPELDYNDYQDLDVAGKVVAVLLGEPASVDPSYFAGEHPTVHSSAAVKQRVAMSRGARGTLLLPSALDPSWKDWPYWQRQFAFDHVSLAYSVPGHLTAWLSPEAAARLFCGAPSGIDEVHAMERRHQVHGFPLATRIRFRGEFVERDFVSSNVAAWIQGSDPQLRDTYVLVSAHYDHLGLGPPVRGDAIYNGVVDNALGVAGVLEIARSVAALPLPPRRSIVFLLTTGEEEGLLGASYYVDHPLVPLSQTVANVNVDGLACLGPFRDVIGIGGELSSLNEVLERGARRRGLASSSVPAVLASLDAYAASDQAAFAEGGIPALLVSEGFAHSPAGPEKALARFLAWGQAHYHQPSDDLQQPLDFEASREHVALLRDLVLDLANDPAAPTWKAGSRFALARLRSQAEGR